MRDRYPRRGKKLKINYRTTDEIRKFAVHLLKGRPIDDLDGGEDDQKGYMSVSHGGEPEVRRLENAAEELNFLRDRLEAMQSDGISLESVCLVARTKQLVQDYGQHLKSAGFQVYEVKRDIPEQRDRQGIRIATMHRVKGLEFEHVIVAGANDGIVPLSVALAGADDQITAEGCRNCGMGSVVCCLNPGKEIGPDYWIWEAESVLAVSRWFVIFQLVLSANSCCNWVRRSIHRPKQRTFGPAATATYCFPFARNVIGGAFIRTLVGNFHSGLPSR